MGLALSPGGTVSGSPKLVGGYTFTARVTDASGSSATSASTSVDISAALAFGGGQVSCSYNGCAVALPFSGGSPPVSVTASGFTFSGNCYPAPPCAPPPAPTVSISGSSILVSVPSPGRNWINGYSGSLTVALSDGTSSASGGVSINVAGG
jgi:hypothetical protein